jgi:uncharacterized protein involved in outer membrane biogenesis
VTDLDLQVQLDRLEGILLAIDRATAHVTLAEGKLRLSPLRFDIVGGRAPADAEVDVRAPTPRWWLQAETDDLKLGEPWRQLEAQVPLSGELDFVLDLQARGRSPREIANSLSGDLSLALTRSDHVAVVWPDHHEPASLACRPVDATGPFPDRLLRRACPSRRGHR